LFGKLLIEAPVVLIRDFFTKNAMNCLINALKGEDRYLQRTANKAMQNLQKRIEAEPRTAATLFEDLLRGTNFVDFDKLTKTRTIEKLMSIGDTTAQLEIVQTLHDILFIHGSENPEVAALQNRQGILLQGKFFAQWMSRPQNIELNSERLLSHSTPSLLLENLPSVNVLKCWIRVAYFPSHNAEPEFAEDIRGLAKAKLSTCLEQTLKAGTLGKHMLHSAIGEIRSQEEKSGPTVIAFEPAVRSILDRGWERFQSLGASWELRGGTAKHASGSTPFEEGLLLLYSLTLFQIYSGDAEAVEILDDLLAYDEQSQVHSAKNGVGKSEDQSDALIEILLSFASKPSKFLRRIINIIFEWIAPQITSKGLDSLVRILATKESVEGQQEMFDAADADSQDEDEDDDSDVEMIDSDVEVVSASSGLEEESEDEEEDTQGEDGKESEDEELAAFDAKLAAALGTRKLTNGAEIDDDSSTSGASDTDMDDDQMMVLDQKLAEVFRARQQETGKKQEKKDARETIVNFKNRVLDLVEIYLKVEYLASRSLELLLPVLLLARKTKTKQLADRSCNILNDFCKRCKGVNVPACNDDLAGVELLLALHAEAGTGASNAHANAASHASILLVKSLVNGGIKVEEVVDVYADTQKRLLTDKKCKVQAGLFTDWNNWCVSARERFAE
jgi:DNA polymerase phi